jgi:hypothetical protein
MPYSCAFNLLHSLSAKYIWKWRFILKFILVVDWLIRITKSWMSCMTSTDKKVCIWNWDFLQTHFTWYQIKTCLLPKWIYLHLDYFCFLNLGLEILAFPCNQFAGQEPGSNEDIQETVCTRFKAEFPIFDKVRILNSELLVSSFSFIITIIIASICNFKVFYLNSNVLFQSSNWEHCK